MGKSIFEDLGFKKPKEKESPIKGFLSRSYEGAKQSFKDKLNERKELKTAYKEAYKTEYKKASIKKAKREARANVNRKFSLTSFGSLSPALKRASTQEYEKPRPKSNMEKMLGL